MLKYLDMYNSCLAYNAYTEYSSKSDSTTSNHSSQYEKKHVFKFSFNVAPWFKLNIFSYFPLKVD